MDNRKTIFAVIIGAVFLFAGYNLWSYFKEQQAIQQAEDRAIIERKVARQQAQERRKQEEADRIANEKREENERQQAHDAKIAKDKAEREAKRQALEQERLQKEKNSADARLRSRIERARTVKHIEGLTDATIDKLNQVSADYIRDNPNEFLGQKISALKLGAYKPFIKLLDENSNALMLYCAISRDIASRRLLI